MNKLPIGTDICECPACKKVFNSTYAFDAHRTGPYTDRRCMSTEEMLQKKMGLNFRNRWVSGLQTHNV
jgi:hypothetical protein